LSLSASFRSARTETFEIFTDRKFNITHEKMQGGKFARQRQLNLL
jgi:hypothetical protein